MASILDLLTDPQHQAEYAQQQRALEAVDKQLAIASHMHNLHEELATKADTADFLTKHAKLDPTGPTYENDVAQTLALHPRTSGPAVDAALAAGRSARSTYLNAVSPGGANEFETGSPEQHAYVTRFRQTSDPIAARAHALNVAKGEEMTKTLISKGLLDPAKDFPEWDGNPQSKPAVYNDDGSVNYHQLGLVAATRAGSNEGLAGQKEQKKLDEQTYRDSLGILNKWNSYTDKYQKEQAESSEGVIAKHAQEIVYNRAKYGNINGPTGVTGTAAAPATAPTGATASTPAPADASAFVP